jgi:hypothetical protein
MSKGFWKGVGGKNLSRLSKILPNKAKSLLVGKIIQESLLKRTFINSSKTTKCVSQRYGSSAKVLKEKSYKKQVNLGCEFKPEKSRKLKKSL